MCGIVAYLGEKPARPILLEGLKRLEYRGYDSAGVAVLEEGSLRVDRAVGRIAELEKRLAATQIPALQTAGACANGANGAGGAKSGTAGAGGHTNGSGLSGLRAAL